MYAWCVGELGLCEQAAFKRIHAARAARRFPAIFTAIADGRLNLSAVTLLGPYLTDETVEDLLGAAAYRSKAEIERLVASRFPRREVPTPVTAIDDSPSRVVLDEQLSPGKVPSLETQPSASAPSEVHGPHSESTPPSPERFPLHVVITGETRDKLRYAEELFSHRIRPGDLAHLLDRALDALIREGEKRKFGATARPRRAHRPSSPGTRHIPAQVRRAIWKRDQGQCTFVSECGRRCAARSLLEFDHVRPVARGGEPTVENLRLRCRAHNQHEAERVFSASFVSRKRTEARARAAEERAKKRAEEIVPGLRNLGFSVEEARRAAAFCERMSEVPLEERFRAALSYLRPKKALPAGSCRRQNDHETGAGSGPLQRRAAPVALEQLAPVGGEDLLHARLAVDRIPKAVVIGA
jgi:5-methylcytosine-specific restriction endonuclease McrA